MEEELTDAQQQAMMEKLLNGFKPATVTTGMTEAEKRMAEKLLGRANSERLARTGRDEKFRYRKPVHTAEYWMDDVAFGGGWCVDIFENGKRLPPFRRHLDHEEIKIVVDALKAKGIPVRFFQTEAQRREPSRLLPPMPYAVAANWRCHKVKPKSERRAILDSLKDFKA